VLRTAWLCGFFSLYAVVSAGGLALIRAAFKGNEGGGALVAVRQPLFWMGFILYGLGFLLWMWFLSKHRLSMAFPLAAGSLFIATTVFSAAGLRESINLTYLIGLICILGGMVLISAATQQQPAS
jgi:drug/metabolite transporter (DMT)-like permease